MKWQPRSALLALAALTSLASRVHATEVCGNGADDDGNGMEDEGCYPTMTTGVCESPLSCGDTGMVSWSTGIVHFDLPPDVAPRVRGARALTAHGTVTHSVAVSGWSRKGFKLAENANNAYVQSTAGPNPSTTSSMWLMLVSFNTVAPATKHTLQFIGSSVSESALTTGGKLEADDGASSAIGVNTMSSTVIPLIFKIDRSIPQQVLYSGAETLAPTWSAPTSSTTMSFGGVSSRSSDATVLYSGMWTGTNAQLSDTTVATLISKIEHGPGVLSSVTIGGQLAQKIVYTNGLVTQITDAAGNNVVSFTYDSTTPGKVVRVDTPRGTLGFEFNTTRAGCTTGNTVLYFNKGNTTSCNVGTPTAARDSCAAARAARARLGHASSLRGV